MRRARRVVTAGVLAVLLVLAGCSGPSGDFGGDPTPLPTPDLDDEDGTPTPPAVTPAPPSSADTERGRAFLEGLSTSQFPVRSVTTANGAFRVTYVSNDGRLLRDAYVLGLAYGGTVNRTWRNDSTWAATKMDALAVGADGGALARYRMPASWPLQYFRGTISAETFSSRLRATLERTGSDGQYPERSGQLTDFYNTADRTAVNVAGASTRNRTVFMTVRAPAADRERLRSALSEVVAAYGSATADWETAALELSIRDRDGEFVGWYRADADFAANVSAGEADVTLAERRFLAEGGRLLG
ncbi:hypothetical protein [Halorientalis regularis]|uniref:DUF8159 domain-containing protein n=1 Tax=Halorientalis regularis TaxID=660518 RepID=A0A1G7MWZ5_9EURY|nr:hypothetical protein [Halorientalis regularis]SDF65639.1 hypothetical protein SAMN05216218_10877 [Halorientalis regularis]